MIRVILTACMLSACCLIQAAELLDNGTFSVANGKAESWSMTPQQALTATAEDLPEGVSQGVSLTIADESKGDGQLLQRIYVTDATPAKLMLSGWLRGSESRVGYIQVKLYDEKKELSRDNVVYSASQWQSFRRAIDTTGVKKIEVICRWRRYARYKDATVQFADFRLIGLDKSIALVGDSTVQNYPTGSSQRGWGQLLPDYLIPEVAVDNRAVGGKSTKTFRLQDRWEQTLASKPYYVLIQFGHNDSHEPGRPESTDAATTYRDNLRIYVQEARAAGVTPILVTPPPRRVFRRDGTLGTALVPYAESTRLVAQELDVPCVDLYALAGKRLEELGEEGAIPYYVSLKDRSHFSEVGASWLAGLVAASLRDQVPELADWWRAETTEKAD